MKKLWKISICTPPGHEFGPPWISGFALQKVTLQQKRFKPITLMAPPLSKACRNHCWHACVSYVHCSYHPTPGWKEYHWKYRIAYRLLQHVRRELICVTRGRGSAACSSIPFWKPSTRTMTNLIKNYVINVNMGWGGGTAVCSDCVINIFWNVTLNCKKQTAGEVSDCRYMYRLVHS